MFVEFCVQDTSEWPRLVYRELPDVPGFYTSSTDSLVAIEKEIKDRFKEIATSNTGPRLYVFTELEDGQNRMLIAAEGVRDWKDSPRILHWLYTTQAYLLEVAIGNRKLT